MRLRASLAALAATLLCLPASAQVSITSSNLFPHVPGQPATFDNFSTDGAGAPAADEARIDALIALRGANQTWDFTTITYPLQIGTTITYFTTLAGVPGAANFPTANVAVGARFTPAMGPGSTSYTYAVNTSASFTAVGVYIEASPDSGSPESIQTYDAGGLVQYTFPFTAGSAVMDQTVITQVFDGQPVMTTLEETRTVLGYGTLVTPLGSAPCLMIRETVEASSPGVPGTLITQYVWRTPSESISASASGQDFAPGLPNYTASHTILRSGGTASEASPSTSQTLVVSAAPNPARGTTAVRLTAFAPVERASVTVTDALGREVARLHDGPLSAGDHAFSLDASGLAPGVYVVRVAAGAQSVTTRLSVAR